MRKAISARLAAIKLLKGIFIVCSIFGADGESDATAVSSAIAFSLVETKSGRNHLPLIVGLFGDWEKVRVE